MIYRRNIATWIRCVLAVALVVAAGFPIYWMIATAITPSDQIYGGKQPLVPDFTRTLNIFQVLVRDSPFLHWMGNSAIVAVGTAITSILLASLAAYALSRYKFVGKGVISFALLATQMLPEALLVVPLYSTFVSLGLLNKLYTLVLVDAAFAMPVAIFVLKTAMDQVPPEVEESARVDGCGTLSILRMIVIPLIGPSVAAAAVITFFDGWNEYLFATTFINSGNKADWVATTGIASFIGEFQTPKDLVFSAAIVFAIPAVAFFLLMQRRIVSGLTAGSVKG